MCLESKQLNMHCIVQLNFDSAAAEKSTLQMGEKIIYPDFAANPLLLYPCWLFFKPKLRGGAEYTDLDRIMK